MMDKDGTKHHPLASFSVITEPENLEVSFEALNCGQKAQEYVWNFGDSHILKTNESRVTHTYLKFGSYLVTLTCTYLNEEATTQVMFYIHEKLPTPKR